MRLRSFRSVLDECVAALQQGETLQSCLDRYPRQATRLRPLLALAQQVGRTPPVVPRLAAQRTSWELVRQRAAQMRRGRRPIAIQASRLRPFAIAAAVFGAVIAAGGATTYAAQDSLPDSPLYRVKLLSEGVRLLVVFDDADKADLLLDQSQERTDEIMALLQQGKPVPANVLGALKKRDERAADLIENQPGETELLARSLQQSQAQETLLLALWNDVSQSARDEYAEAVAALHNTRLRGSGTAVTIAPDDLARGVLDISGTIEPVAEEVWRVGGVEVRIDKRTFDADLLEPGRTARIIAARGSDGRLLALNLAAFDPGPIPGALVSGAVEEVSDDQILIGGQWIGLTADTLLKLKLTRGQRVQIAVSSQDGRAVAAEIESGEDGPASAPSLAYEGTVRGEVSAADQTNEWNIGGLAFVITPATLIDAQAGPIQEGARARVEAITTGDGLVAQRVTVLAVKTDENSVHLSGVFQGSNEGRWLVSGMAVEVQEGEEAPTLGSLVTVSAERAGGRTFARQVDIVERPGDATVHLEGVLAAMDGHKWTVGFTPIELTDKTKLFGEPITGVRVLVWGQRGEDGVLQAKHVRILDQRPIIKIN